MTPLTPARARQVFLLLTLTRWFPVGLIVTVTTLLPIERGLSVPEALTALSVTGFTVFLLELPTSGLADSLGRRPMLIAAALLQVVAAVLFLTAADVLGVRAGRGGHRCLPCARLRPPGGVVRRHGARHRARGRRRPAAGRAQHRAGRLDSRRRPPLGRARLVAPVRTRGRAIAFPYAVYAVLSAVHLVAVTILVPRGAAHPTPSGGRGSMGRGPDARSPRARRPA